MVRLLSLVITVGFVLGLMFSGGSATAGPDPCDSSCSIFTCGGCCDPFPAMCPPVKHYRCYQYYGPVECEGPFTCRCNFIGCGGLCEYN